MFLAASNLWTITLKNDIKKLNNKWSKKVFLKRTNFSKLICLYKMVLVLSTESAL